MSNHYAPEGVAPDELRCEALVRAKQGTFYREWERHDRRCPRRANQTRNGFAVCYIHALTKSVDKALPIAEYTGIEKE